MEKETEEDMPNLNINNEIKKKDQEEKNINDNKKENLKNNIINNIINIIKERKRYDKDKLVSLNNNSYRNIKNLQLDSGKKSSNCNINSKIIPPSPYQKKLKNHSFVFIKQVHNNE